MRHCLKSVSLFLLFLWGISDVKAQAYTPPINEGHFATQLDFFGRHFSGILIAKKIDTTTHRLVFVSETGFRYFDFAVNNDSIWLVSCIEPLQRKGIQSLLKTDLRYLVSNSGINRFRTKEIAGKIKWEIAPKRKYVVSYCVQAATENSPQFILVRHKSLPVRYFFRHLPKTE